MRKIAVALSKGGVGKTTTSVNLAVGLANAGERVLLIDVDTQGQAAKMLGVEPSAGLAEVVTNELAAKKAICAARPGLSLLAGGRALAGLKRVIARKDFGGEQALAEALAPLDDLYDFVILDTAPGWDALTINALFYADEVLSPVALEVMALQGLHEFVKSLSAIQNYRAGLSLRYIVPTFLDRRVKKSTEVMALLDQHFADQLCTPIRYSVRLSEAPGFGQSIFEYAPGSSGAEDYRALARRIERDGSS